MLHTWLLLTHEFCCCSCSRTNRLFLPFLSDPSLTYPAVSSRSWRWLHAAAPLLHVCPAQPLQGSVLWREQATTQKHAATHAADAPSMLLHWLSKPPPPPPPLCRPVLSLVAASPLLGFHSSVCECGLNTTITCKDWKWPDRAASEKCWTLSSHLLCQLFPLFSWNAFPLFSVFSLSSWLTVPLQVNAGNWAKVWACSDPPLRGDQLWSFGYKHTHTVIGTCTRATPHYKKQRLCKTLTRQLCWAVMSLLLSPLE